MNALPLYVRLGVDLETDIALEHRLRPITSVSKPGIDLAIDKRLAIDARHQVVLAYYLLERRSKVLEHAMALVAEVQDFFLGDWVESYVVNRWVEDPTHSEGGYKRAFVTGREWCRREFRWMESYRDGLLWALWLNDDAAALRLAGYPGDDVREQEFDYGPADKAWRVLAAYLLLENPSQDWTACTQVIERTRAKKPRLLLAALRAIAAGDAATFRKAVSETIRHHVRTDADEAGLDNKLALDASLMIQIARRAGMSVELKPAERDRVVM